MRRSNFPGGWAVAALTVTLTVMLVGCDGGTPPADPTPGASGLARPNDRDALAALAAAAKDRRFVASYTLSARRQPDRIVTVAIATDGSWVVAVPGGALGGLADIAMFSAGDQLYQCALGPAAGAAGSRPDLPPVTPGCVKVNRLTASIDPRIHHIFTDWIDALIDRASAVSVAAAPLLPGAHGECYSVESNSAALAPPVDPGIYCYDREGILTAARLDAGSLTLAGAVAPAPPTVAQPAAEVARAPVSMRAPSPPSHTPSPSRSAP